jgi:CRP/FNR family transcriptional regulator
MDKFLKPLSSIPLFNALNHEQLNQLGQIAHEKKFHKNQIIFHEGDHGNGLYLIIEGAVKVFKLSNDGKEHILFLFYSGQIFGEVSIFAGEHYSANASAIAATHTLYIHRSGFLDLIEKSPGLTMRMLADLSNKLCLLTAQIESLTLKEVPARLADYLLFVSQKQGWNTHVDLRISKSHLASMLGSLPETLSRAFAKLANQGLIRVEGSRIILLDSERLRILSENGKRLY